MLTTRATIPEAAGAPRLGLRTAIDSWRLRSFEEIRREHVEAVLVALQDAGARPATVSIAYRCLQAFWKWAVSEDEVRESPMARMTPPIVPEEPPPILRPEQIKAILDACAGTGFEARRDTALVRLLLDTGMRRGGTSAAPVTVTVPIRVRTTGRAWPRGVANRA